jgi:hypothetical protein
LIAGITVAASSGVRTVTVTAGYMTGIHLSEIW